MNCVYQQLVNTHTHTHTHTPRTHAHTHTHTHAHTHTHTHTPHTHTHTQRKRETDRQIDRQTDRQTERGRQTDRQRERITTVQACLGFKTCIPNFRPWRLCQGLPSELAMCRRIQPTGEDLLTKRRFGINVLKPWHVWTVVIRSLHRHWWHHIQSFLHGAVPRSLRETSFAVSVSKLNLNYNLCKIKFPSSSSLSLTSTPENSPTTLT